MRPEHETGSDPAADQAGDTKGEGQGEGCPPPASSGAPGEPDKEAGTQDATESNSPAGEAGGGEPDGNFDQEGEGGAGAAEPAAQRKYSRISRQTFRAACIAGDGNPDIIAKAVGCNAKTVLRRIAEDPELSAMYGADGRDIPDRAPNAVQVMNRSLDDLPASVSVEIGSAAPSDVETYRNALRAYGVSERRLAKIKSLDGLAKDWATHMSISLRSHHQSYDGQLHNLAELADDIDERLKGIKQEDGSYIPLDSESYSYLAKIRVECVKESGRGVEVMLALTEALVRMTKGSDTATPVKASAGWGPMKKVRAAG